MPIYVEYPSSSALVRRCRELQEVTKPTSRAMMRAREDFRLIVAEDHYEMLIRGVDRYGRPRAPLAESTLKNKKRGPGPSLIPRFWESRFIFNVQIRWIEEGGERYLVKRFVDILSDAGKPFAQYHLTGATKPGTNWVLPRRDVGGVTPAGFSQLKSRFQKFVYDIWTYQQGVGG